MTQQELLSVFQLQPGASWSEVRDAYRRLMKQWHPDKHQTDEDARLRAEKFSRRLNHCFDLLEALYKNGASTVTDHSEAAQSRQEDLYREYCRQYHRSQAAFYTEHVEKQQKGYRFFDYLEVGVFALGLAIILFIPVFLVMLSYASPLGSCLNELAYMADQVGLNTQPLETAYSALSFHVIEPLKHWFLYL